MTEPTQTDSAELLDEAASLLERAVLDAPLSHAERAYLASTSTRLHGLARQVRDGIPAPLPDEPDELPKAPQRLRTRKEAAAVIGCHPNTLVRLEERGLLTPSRDYRGWRTYGREDMARAMALLAHVPLADAKATR